MFRPASGLTARLIVQLLTELPDDSAFIASIKASQPPDAVDSPAVKAFRSRRTWRGWTTDRMLRADIRDLLAGQKQRYPRPWDGAGNRVSARRVLDLDEFPNF